MQRYSHKIRKLHVDDIESEEEVDLPASIAHVGITPFSEGSVRVHAHQTVDIHAFRLRGGGVVKRTDGTTINVPAWTNRGRLARDGSVYWRAGSGRSLDGQHGFSLKGIARDHDGYITHLHVSLPCMQSLIDFLNSDRGERIVSLRIDERCHLVLDDLIQWALQTPRIETLNIHAQHFSLLIGNSIYVPSDWCRGWRLNSALARRFSGFQG